MKFQYQLDKDLVEEIFSLKEVKKISLDNYSIG